MRVQYTQHNNKIYGKLADSGWIPCPLEANMSTQSWATFSYRRIGDVMYLTGLVIVGGSSTGEVIVSKLPYKPAIETDFMSGFLKRRFFITPNGELKARDGNSGGTVDMLNVSYPIS